jgi:nitrogen fixation NifU-like protein
MLREGGNATPSKPTFKFSAKGKTLDEALKITNKMVADELGGLPSVKMHCSNLAANAIKKAITDYKNNKKKK